METRKMIAVEQLQYSELFMEELYRKLRYVPAQKQKVNWNRKSETLYFVLNQKQWKKNDCTFYLTLSDGKEHNRLEMELPMHTGIDSWRFALEVHYYLDKNDKTQLEIKATNIIIKRASKMDITFSQIADENTYFSKLDAEKKTIKEATNIIKKK